MRETSSRFLLIGCGVLLVALCRGRAFGEIQIEAPAVSAAAGSSGSFDLVLTNTGGNPVEVTATKVELGVSGAGVEFTDTTTATSAAYIFTDSFDNVNGFTLDANAGTEPYPKTDFIVSDLENDSSEFQTVATGQVYGVAHVSYSIDAGVTPGVNDLTIERPNIGTSFTDPNANAIPFTISNGSITVTAVPDPGFWGCWVWEC